MNIKHNPITSSTRITISNLPLSELNPFGRMELGNHMIRAMASAWGGEVVDVFQIPNRSRTGPSGRANVSFATEEQAAKALEMINNSMFGGRVLRAWYNEPFDREVRPQRRPDLATNQPVQFFRRFSLPVETDQGVIKQHDLVRMFGWVAGDNGKDLNDPEFEYAVRVTDGKKEGEIWCKPGQLFFGREISGEEVEEHSDYPKAA